MIKFIQSLGELDFLFVWGLWTAVIWVFALVIERLANSRDGQILGLNDRLKTADDSIAVLHNEKQDLEDEVKELKDYREAVQEYITDPEKIINAYLKADL